MKKIGKTTVGSIGLNLVLNSTSFTRQLNTVQTKANVASKNISSSFKKIGAAVATAFSVKIIANFGKQCLDLGSDLAEVQNVVDVTYGNMSDKADKFAKKAKEQFGLSETMAKKYMGLYGSMAEAFGFTEQESYKIAKGLTGLAGDVASFYNIDQDLAYTKLKSVFSGETETLKDLGIVMTQSALDAYALANGYGKVTKNMTEAEKVQLRYAFVQKQLANAQGDFARTAGSWANQTRLLKLNVDSLKASLGQSFIQVLTPVVKMMNSFVGSLSSASDKISAFLTDVFGQSSSAGQTSQALSSASEEADSLSDSSDNAAKSLTKSQKAAKKLKEHLAGFDKLNVLGQEDNSSSVDGKNNNSAANTKAPTMSLPLKVKKKTIDSLAKQLKKYIKQGDFEKVGEIFGEKISSGMKKLKWDKIKTRAKGIADKTGNFINGFFKGFDWKLLGNHIGEGINTAFLTAGTFFKTVDWGQIGEKISDKFNSMFSTIDAQTVGETLASIINAPIKYAENFNYNFNWENFGKKVSTGLTAFVENINLDSAANALSLRLKGIATSSQIIFSSPAWTTLGEKVKNALVTFFEGNPLDNVGNSVRSALRSLFNFAIELFSQKDGKDLPRTLAKDFAKMINSWFTDKDWWGKAGQAVSGIAKGICRFLTEAIKDIDVDKVFDAIVTFLENVDWLGVAAEIASLIITAAMKVMSLVFPQINAMLKDEKIGETISKQLYDSVSAENIKGFLHGDNPNVKAKGASTHTTKGKAHGGSGKSNVPKFAAGGLVKAPTLALVGDNKNAQNDPEVISPLSKLREMIGDGAQTGSDSQAYAVLFQILRMLENIYDKTNTISNNQDGDTVVKIGEEEVFRACRNENRKYKARHGYSGLA